MTGYFWGLLAFAVCCSAVEFLTPSGEGGGLAGHMKWLSGLCLLCVLVTPIRQIVVDGGVIARLEGALEEWLSQGEQTRDEYDDLWQEQYEQMDVAYAEASMTALLQQKFAIASGDVRVRLQVDESREKIESVHVALSGRAVWLNTHEIEAYVEQMLGCECTTYIE